MCVGHVPKQSLLVSSGSRNANAKTTRQRGRGCLMGGKGKDAVLHAAAREKIG